MGEGTHTTSIDAGKTAKKRRMTWIISGTALALLAGAVLFQVFREGTSNEGIAAEEGAASVSEERYLARVNGQLVHWDAVAQECMDRYGKDVLENVINRTIIQQACAEHNVTVSQAEVDQEVVRISKRFGLDVDAWFNLLQAERGVTPVQYERDVIWPMLALKKLAGEQISVTDKEIEKSYINNYGEMVKAKMIMMDHPRRIVEVWEKVRKNPEEFEKLAREYSIESNSASLGGSIPPIRRYSTNPELSKAAFKLKEGEISGIIQLRDGLNRYVFIRCEGRTEPIPHNIEDVKAKLQADLIEEKVQKSVARTFDHIKKTSTIDNYVTRTAQRPARQVSTSGDSQSEFEKAFPEASASGRPR